MRRARRGQERHLHPGSVRSNGKTGRPWRSVSTPPSRGRLRRSCAVPELAVDGDGPVCHARGHLHRLQGRRAEHAELPVGLAEPAVDPAGQWPRGSSRLLVSMSMELSLIGVSTRAAAGSQPRRLPAPPSRPGRASRRHHAEHRLAEPAIRCRRRRHSRPAMKLFVPSMGSITQTRSRGFGQSNVIDWPVSLSSPTTPSSGNSAAAPPR